MAPNALSLTNEVLQETARLARLAGEISDPLRLRIVYALMVDDAASVEQLIERTGLIPVVLDDE